MPTRSRPALAAMALDCYLQQTYQHKELIIVDDAGSPSFETPPDIEGVKYFRLNQRLTVGAKRNICVSRAEGEVICHWDSDDWNHPERLSDQIARLGTHDVTGYNSMRFTDGQRWWQYTAASPDYAVGTSLMYRRSYWEKSPFPDEMVGEDARFIVPARNAGKIICVDAGAYMYATNHAGNTDQRRQLNDPNCLQWREIR